MKPARAYRRACWQYIAAFASSLMIFAMITAAWLLYARSVGLDPPAHITNSLSLNEKLRFVRHNHRYDCQVMAIGSSMTQCNLASAPLIEALGSPEAYLNVASWGTKPADVHTVLRVLLRKRSPRSVIIVTSPMDFYEGPGANVDPESLDRWGESYMDGTMSWWAGQLLQFQLNRVVRDSWRLAQRRRSNRWYGSFVFDEGGAAPTDIRYPNVDHARWNTKLQPERCHDTHYQGMARIADDLQNRGTRLIVVQAPIRADAISPEAEAGLETYCRRLQKILEDRDGLFVNMHRLMSPGQDLFTDYSHLNVEGAMMLSRRLLELPAVRSAILGESTHACVPRVDREASRTGD
jgi:hypothetical protein